MAWVAFHQWMLKQENGNGVDLDTDTVKCLLVTSGRAPVQATDANMSTIDDTQVPTGTAYTAGGPTLANPSVALSTGTVTWDCDDITIAQDAGGGFTTARYAILYKSTGDAANDIPIMYYNFGADKGNVAGPLVLQIAATGLLAKTTS